MKRVKTIPVIWMTSNKLRGSVWVRLCDNKNPYIGWAKIRPTSSVIQKKRLSMKRLRLVRPNLYATTAFNKPASINGVFKMIKIRYLLTEHLQYPSLE